MTELLVQPYRAGNETLVNQYYGLLSLFPNLEWVAPDLATAIGREATGLLTNDPDLARVPEIEVGVRDQMR